MTFLRRCHCLFLQIIKPPLQSRMASLHPLRLLLASKNIPVQILENTSEIPTMVSSVIFPPLSNMFFSLRSVGAKAIIYDISCFTPNSQKFKTIQDLAYEKWIGTFSTSVTPLPFLEPLVIRVGNHFSQNSSTGIKPVWDYRKSVKNPEAYVVGDVVVEVPSPSGSKNVNWLQLKGVLGLLASRVCIVFEVSV